MACGTSLNLQGCGGGSPHMLGRQQDEPSVHLARGSCPPLDAQCTVTGIRHKGHQVVDKRAIAQ